jgi:serine/threonine-protein kinase
MIAATTHLNRVSSPRRGSLARREVAAAPAARRRLAAHAQRLEAVLEITRLLAAEVELSKLLPLAASKTCAALGADRASVFLVDADRQQLYTIAASALEIAEIRLPLGVGLAGYVAIGGETLNIPDCYRAPRFDRSWDHKTGYRTRSMLVMPMRDHAGTVIGVFQVINKLGKHGEALNETPAPPPFTEDDVTCLRSIAASAAIALQNALLVAETHRMFLSTVAVLAAIVDARDCETAGHPSRVA